MAKTIAAYGGGFKPPTRGHFEIVKNALQEFPEIDEFIIYVGSKERDGIDQAEAILIWEIYENYLPNKVQIKAAQSPIGDILRLAKDNPQDEIYFVIGYREGRDDDMKDVASRTSNLEEKYPNIEVKVMPTFDANMSGTNARKAIGDEEKFIKFLPFEVKEKSQIWNIVRPVGAEALNENATYSQNIDYMQMISDLTNHMLEQGRNIKPLPQLVIRDGETENAKNFFGRTAYYDPNTQTIVLYTEGRHPKDIVRSYAHEMVHHTQNLEGRIGNIQTTDTTADKELDAIEREAYLKGNMMFRNWTDSIDGDVSSSITEGKYDSLVTKLAGFTLNAWKGDFEDGQNEGYFETEVGPGLDFDYPYLKFLYQAKAKFSGVYKSSGSAIPDPIKGLSKVKLNYFLDIEELPEMWEQIAFDLRNTIRHEVEHLMQSGPNVKKGKEKDSDLSRRKELMTGEKPWWAIWRDKYKDAEYYKLEKEVDANLQGLYLKAKKERKPLEFVINNYLLYDLGLSMEDQIGVKNMWRERAPKLNIPLKESKIGSNWKSRVTVAGPVPPAFLEGDVLTYKGYKNRRGNATGKFYPQRDYPVEVIGVWWKEAGEHTYKSEYIYKLRLLRSLNKNNRRGMTFPLQTEKEIKDKLADKQLTRAEFERQPTKRKDSFDKPMTFQGSSLSVDMAALEEDDKDYFGLNKLLKEVLDPKNFNFKPLIKSLTNSMEDDGLILKPYPKVQFIHNAKANSEDFFGKTAYYDPGNNIIVLYTLGRHPKDILRSYAHELVHVHQNHEDRLENITTDNVNEDDYLEKIEREAYEEGNIAFRSWTNKITEKKTKDPFGLNAFAYELARLNEDEEDNWYVYVDMDGVIADFDKRFKDLSGLMPQAYVDKHGLNKFWDLIDEKHKVAFWRGIEIMPGAGKLLNYVSNYPYEILTAPSIKKQSIIGKGLWIKDKIGTLYSAKPKVTYRPAKLKHTVKPNLTKYDVLIDDKKSTIERWNNAGGTAIFYVNADQVINDLKNLGL